jgi:hypothetical protein
MREAIVSARWIKICGLLAFVVIGSATLSVASRWPFTRDTVVRALQEKFASTVKFKAFYGTYFTPGCIVEGVTFRRNGDRNAPPIATIEKLIIQGSYPGFFTTPKRIRRVKVEGLHVFVSPRSERAGNEARPAGSLEQFALILEEIIADGAVVEFASGESGTAPLKFQIHKLTLNSVADDRPMSFHAVLQNPKPLGEIRADGQLGPLRTENVGQTVLSGSYVFHSDLDAFPGIAGTLSSSGNLKGVLEQIEVEGTTDVPDFEVTRSHHAVHLKTQFQAIVDGMDGDVVLQSVHAQFARSSLVSQGQVANEAGSDGKTLSLVGTEQQGHIQDWLRLLAKADRPAVTGAMNFRAQVRVPPGNRRFIEKVNLQGDFGIDGAGFTHPATQEKIDNLSQVAQGEKQNDDPASVVENLKGHVVLKDAIAAFSDFSFSVPGALAHVHGTYGLLTEQINLHGTLRVDNKFSKTSKGTKSFLLKFVEPLLTKQNAGEIVPIKIGGTFSDPSYGLDLAP